MNRSKVGSDLMEGDKLRRGQPRHVARPYPRPPYRPELDGLHGIAVLLVILGHLVVPIALGGGVVGVTLFFVLSGYLITTILVTDLDSGGIRLGMK
jgi:peptidoglycan/LPS O-acetylase OafA/YrhL